MCLFGQVMKAPKKIEFEKVYSTMLLLSKKRYAGVMYADGHKWGLQEPPIDIKGMQCVRRDGCPLVRDLVRECLTSILHSGDIVDAGATVRSKLLDIVHDRVPLEAYAVQKTLRKSMQDCSLPMSTAELCEIRGQLPQQGKSNEAEQLSYAEQDQAIRQKIRLPWRMRVKLPHVMLAWRLRKKDPGSAPVLGESVQYVVTNNGGKQIWEKVEALEHVKKSPAVTVDRQYYLDALKVPLDNIFFPVCMQRCGNEPRARKTAKDMLWQCVHGLALKSDAQNRRAAIEASPLALAFKKQKQAPPKQ
jgi:DNA polymerase delta subunit 1